MYIIGGDRHTVSFNDTHLLRMDKAIESLNYYSWFCTYHFLNSITYEFIIISNWMGNTEFPSQFTDKEIQKLYARFQEIDKDKSGDLDPE